MMCKNCGHTVMEVERKCKRCQSPFDPSWSGNPKEEEFCSDYCKKEYTRGW